MVQSPSVIGRNHESYVGFALCARQTFQGSPADRLTYCFSYLYLMACHSNQRYSMRILAYVPSNAANEADVIQAIDDDLPDQEFTVDYASDAQELSGLVGTHPFDVMLLFVDGKLPNPAAYMKGINFERFDGPVVCLHQHLDTHGLFGVLGYGCVSATPLAAGFKKGTIGLLLRNAYYAYGGRSRVKQFGALRIDYVNKTCDVNGMSVEFTPQEFEVFTCLTERTGKLCTKDNIHDYLYQLGDEDIDLKIVDVFVHKVRKKLREAAPHLELDSCIETVWGSGYKFVPAGERTNVHVIGFGPLVINFTEQTVSIDNQPIPLTIGEFMVLKTLAYHFPKPVDATLLADEASKFGRVADEASIQRYVALLNKKLSDYGDAYNRLILGDGDGKYFLNLSQIAPKIASALESDIYTLGPIRINHTIGETYFKGERLDLTSREMDVLVAFIETYPGLMTIEQMAEKVYGDETRTGAAMQQFNKLRAKLAEANGGIDPIITRRRLGYMLDIKDARALKKAAADIEITNVGRWTLNATRAEISFKGSDGKTVLVPLPRQPYVLMKAILESYPNALKRVDALKVLYGDDAPDRQASLVSVYGQLGMKLKEAGAENAGSLRRFKDALFRLDLPQEDVAPSVLENCSITDIGAWSINHTLQELQFDGTRVDVSDTEFFVVELLAKMYPEVVSADIMTDTLFSGSRPALNAFLTNLRKKLREEHNITEPLIRTIRGVGFVLAANREELEDTIVDEFRTAVVGDIEINLSLCELRVDGKSIALGSSELFVLDTLSRADAPLSAAQISEASDGKYSEAAVISVLNASIPKKLEDAGIKNSRLFENVRSIGYMMKGRRQHILERSQIQELKGMRLNHTLRELTVEDKTIDLAPVEYHFLKTMFDTPRVPLSPENVQQLMLEDDTIYSDATIKLAKVNITGKLEQAGVKKFDIIKAKNGVGYYLAVMEKDLNVSRLQGVRSTAVTGATIINAGRLSLNTVGEKVTLDGKPVARLEGKTFDLLCFFAKSHLEAVTPEQIARQLFSDMPPSKALTNVGLGINGLRTALNRHEEGLGNRLIREYKAGRKKTDPVIAYTLAFNEDEFAFVSELLVESRGSENVFVPAAPAA
ncbi:MAG: hypothetical protein EBQ96_05340 [Proteobacteria bacterium]|nr:hypothetical protein [Pseudomonadota bacterium]